jgi:hypothetical protein
MARSLGVQSTKALEALGLDVPQDVLEKVEAIVDGKEPRAQKGPPAGEEPQPPAAPATAPTPQ